MNFTMKKRSYGRKIQEWVTDSYISAHPQNSTEFLPADLSQEIFLKLPCKDIVSCKCVCREWYKLLSDPTFTSNYARNSPFTSLLLFERRDATSCLFFTNSLCLLEFAANGGVVKTPLKPKIPDFQKTDSRIHMIGSRNGLLFLLSEYMNLRCCRVEKVYCCNPLLGGCVVLAEQEWPRQDGHLWFVEYFIGYISSGDTIKLLRIVYNDSEGVKQAFILTAGIDRKWRRVDDQWNLYYKSRGVSFNGAYVWIVKHGNLRYLCTFDFGEEINGGKSKLPDLLQHRKKIDLVVVNNRLSVIDISDSFQMTVWTMEEYGVAESWSRKIILWDWYMYKVGGYCSVLANGNVLFSDLVSGNIMSRNLEKEPTEIKVHDIETSTYTLHAAELAPRFHSCREDIKLIKHWYNRNVSDTDCALLQRAIYFSFPLILLIFYVLNEYYPYTQHHSVG